MTPEYAHRWKPLEPLAQPTELEVPELRAFEALWRTQKERLSSTGAYQSFWERLARSWSIETGIIERIYDLSAGATELLIERGFEATLIHHGDSDTRPEQLIAILNDHRAGLGLVMDLIAGRRELSPGWIKELHALLCRHQETVSARELGPLQRIVEIRFEHGAYKKRPNSPTLADGRVHEYCPPEHVASEIERMIAIYHGLPESLPEVRSAWLHLAFTQIHPFQDGNGRIARALASIDFIREGPFPLVVDRADRDKHYMPALQHGDRGSLKPLVQFFSDCEKRAIIQAISAAEEAIVRVGGRRAAIDAARSKVLARGTADAERRRGMARRIDALADAAHEAFKTLANEVQSAVPGVRTRTMRSNPGNEHYWTKQIVEIAKTRRYWADTRERRSWVRLQLEDGGLTDLVVVLHFVGNPSPGSCMSGAFLVHRDRESERIEGARFTHLPQEPLLLVVEEEDETQRARFLRWVDEVVVVALAEWKRRL